MQNCQNMRRIWVSFWPRCFSWLMRGSWFSWYWDQVLICLLVLIILSLGKTASTPWPPALLRKQEEAGEDKHTNIYRLFPRSPCVSNMRFLWLVLYWRVSVLGQSQETRALKAAWCQAISLLHCFNPPTACIISARLYPCFFAQALIHIAALRLLLGCSFHTLHLQLNTLAFHTRLDSKPILLPWPPLSSAFFFTNTLQFSAPSCSLFQRLLADSWSSSSSP